MCFMFLLNDDDENFFFLYKITKKENEKIDIRTDILPQGTAIRLSITTYTSHMGT
jgi:hypothetical protein